MPALSVSFDRPGRAVCETLHIVALALWLAATLASGLVAAVAFPAMKSLAPTIPGYAEPSQHYLIAAGAIAQRVFLVADVVNFVAGIIALATLGVSVLVLGTPARRPATIVRSLGVAIAIACLASLLLIVTPRVVGASTQHWAALKANDLAAARTHKAALDDVHPIASRLTGGMAFCVFIALVSGVWSIARAPREHTL